MITVSEKDTESDLFLQVGQEIDVEFPQAKKKYSQDEEFCTITMDGVSKRIRFHDYHEIYPIPGLYEKIFYEQLRCCSPKTVCDLFVQEMNTRGYQSDQLRVLEIGAGNGMVGEQLKEFDIQTIAGVDILIEAKLAAYRDRPDVYDEYYAIDLTDFPESIEEDILRKELNSLVSVAALGFDDLPPLAYAKAFNLISEKGWIAFNIKDLFIGRDDHSGFATLLNKMVKENIVTIHEQKKYQHRLAIDDTPLYYYAIVGQKNADIPRDWLSELA